MRTVAAIRTHVWTDQEDRLMAQLQPIFGDDLLVVFHNRPDGLVPPLPVVDLTDDWLAEQGLRHVPDYGWRCGDYFLYALRQAVPDADYYWLIEPDVYFSGNPEDFFDRLGQNHADLVGMATERLPATHRWARSMLFVSYRCVFALTRVSGPALDHLFRLRQDYGKQPIGGRSYANDEVFVWSNLKADPDYSTAELVDIVPDWTRDGIFGADPDILLDTLSHITTRGIFHPVQSRQHFIRAVSGRVGGAVGFLARMKDSLAHLTDDEMQALFKATMVQVRSSLYQARKRGVTLPSDAAPSAPDSALSAPDQE